MSKLRFITYKPYVGLLVLLAILTTTIGCSSGEEIGLEVTGSVTVKGENLLEGDISFEPTPVKGRTGVSVEIADGKFLIPSSKALKPGKYKVRISSMQSTGRQVINADMPDEMVDEMRETIPIKYNLASQLTSELTAELQQPLIFDLQ